MTKIVGLTGNIASGKSTVAKFIRKQKLPIHESDNEVRLLYKKPTKHFLNYLIKIKLGQALFNKKINKKIIRKEIFENSKKRELLEKFIHSEVKKKRNKFLKKNINKKNKVIFLDIPLLFEKKLDKICNFIICVYAPLGVRKRRALNRPGMNKVVLNLIIKSQIKDSEKKRKADFVINTTKSKNYSHKEILQIIKQITT